MLLTILILTVLLTITTERTVQYYILKNKLFLQREFQKFINTETKIIEVEKWIHSEKAGKDLGDAFISEWITKNAAELRKAWNRSKCRKCNKNCTKELRISCQDFEKEKI